MGTNKKSSKKPVKGKNGGTLNSGYYGQGVGRPKGVGIIIKARHLCMEMRGVKKTAETTTSKLLGIFMENENSRSEFMRLAR